MNNRISFNKSVKNTIISQKIEKKCCKTSFLLGMMLFSQFFEISCIRVNCENPAQIEKISLLTDELFGIDIRNFIGNINANQMRINISDESTCKKIISGFGYDDYLKTYHIPDEIFKCDSCLSYFLKGVFLSCGNVTSPEKDYHLDLTVSHFNLSRELLYYVKKVFPDIKYSKRTSHYILYYKESEKILDFLNYLGAHKEAFSFCDAKIEKEIRNTCNRITNCETANLSKVISASSRQIEAILFLKKSGKLKDLPEDLKYTALIRLENPEASLSELAFLHSPAVTKSCVTHRLQKLVSVFENCQA